MHRRGDVVGTALRAVGRKLGRAAVLAPLALLMLLVGCERPDVLVMCHNANCAGPPDPHNDDTIESLRESLRLTHRGRPVLDGVELDIFWHGEGHGGAGRCTFSHDIDTAARAADAEAAAEEIAAFLEQPGEVSHNGQRFYIRLELKGSVGSYGDEHSPEQRQQHADCALDLLDIFADVAQRTGRALQIIFDSSEPTLLRTLVSRPRWPLRRDDPLLELRLSADFIDSTPSGLALQRLSDFPPVDDVVFHTDWIRDGHYQAFRSLELSMTLWMFSANVETFDAIERLEPNAVLTSEAPLLRRWLEY